MVYYNQRFAAAVGLLFLTIAVALGVLLSHRVASPLHGIARDMEQVGQFQLSLAPLPPSFIKEIAVVSDAVDRMKASLRSFGRYVPTELVRELLARGEEARLGGETRCLTIQFSDVESFTRISERLAPAEVVHHLAEYLAIVTAPSASTRARWTSSWATAPRPLQRAAAGARPRRPAPAGRRCAPSGACGACSPNGSADGQADLPRARWACTPATRWWGTSARRSGSPTPRSATR